MSGEIDVEIILRHLILDIADSGCFFEFKVEREPPDRTTHLKLFIRSTKKKTLAQNMDAMVHTWLELVGIVKRILVQNTDGEAHVEYCIFHHIVP